MSFWIVALGCGQVRGAVFGCEELADIALGCEETPELTPDERYVLVDARLPRAPGDPVRLEVEDLSTWAVSVIEPVVVDAGGREVPVEPLADLPPGTPYAWAPVEPLAPGFYRVVGTRDPAIALDLPFEVGPFGAEPVDGAALVGRSWAMGAGWSAPSGLLEMRLDEPQELLLSVESVADRELRFVLSIRDERGAECVLLRDEAAWDPAHGVARWADPGSTLVDPSGARVPVSELSLTLAWSDAHPGELTATAGGTADVRELGHLLDDADPCVLLEALGGTCEPCPSDGAPTCVHEAAYGVSARETDPSPLGLPLCGVDRSGAHDPPDLEPITCDAAAQPELGCGCRSVAAQAGAPMLLALGLTAIRRRKR